MNYEGRRHNGRIELRMSKERCMKERRLTDFVQNSNSQVRFRYSSDFIHPVTLSTTYEGMNYEGRRHDGRNELRRSKERCMKERRLADFVQDFGHCKAVKVPIVPRFIRIAQETLGTG
ncbi:hypothetical protein L1887_05005 [Cichorium endivia]|nr:hypothetical protein L1887_05005 [Cichorium endivia]